jgi:hypothetical protein
MKFFILISLFILSDLVWAQNPIQSPILDSKEEWEISTSNEEWKNFHISSIDKSYAKVVSINNGHCSGSVISQDGYILTNYHCFFEQFARFEKDLVEHGFYAKNNSASLPLEGVEIEILDTAIEVTKSIPKLENSTSEIINNTIDSILSASESNTAFRFVIKKFEDQERYFLIRYTIFNDIRMICIPPENAANFGGQTMNWTWPRYAMDFCILKINASTDYQFKKFDIAKSFEEKDKVLNASFPASTNRNASSNEIDYKINFENNIRNLIRSARMYILKEEIYFQEDLPGKYKSQYSDISNYTLFIEGESDLINKMKLVKSVKDKELKYSKSNKELDNCLNELDYLYAQLKAYSLFRLYLNEALVAPEIFLFSFKFNVLLNQLQAKDDLKISATTERLIESTRLHFSDYSIKTDKKMFFKMLDIYDKSLPDSLKPEFLKQKKLEFNNDLYLYSQYIFDNTVFNSEYKLLKYLEAPKANILESDPAFEFVSQFIEHYFTKIAPKINEFNKKIEIQNLIYRQFIPHSNIDANGTLMISSGIIEGYELDNAIKYKYMTQVKYWNLTSRDNTKLLSSKFEESINKIDSIPLCYVSSIDVTSGSSGSPVINENGELIGLVFDQNQEGMSNQFVYNSEIQRGICLNINMIGKFMKTYFKVNFFEGLN